MSRAILLASVFVVAVSFLAIVQAKDRTYTVSGSVINLDGIPVASALVTVMGLGDHGGAGQLLTTAVDANGRFRIALAPGRYVIRAKDEAHGYPDPNFLFSADPRARFPDIIVGDADISGLKVILAAKGGIIDGILRDRVSLRLIPNGKVVLRDAANPDVLVQLSADRNGRFEFAVPNKPILISGVAPGYTSTLFADGEPLTLSGGERRDVSMTLQPK
ncbi:MAG TPA: carboxypeptidase-like regulatory domain-containing protein [Terriglobales bacterium]|nr:carboxypeptidase-like regulatory domain-containing protein [Terriglobales bacterium]